GPASAVHRALVAHPGWLHWRAAPRAGHAGRTASWDFAGRKFRHRMRVSNQQQREEIMRGIPVAIAVLIAALAFSTNADAAAEGRRVVLFVGPTQDKYLGALSRSIADTATAAGMKVTTFSSPFDPALQAQQIDDAIAQKFDLFVVQTISQKA